MDFSHAGDCGDLLAHLPVVRALGGGKLWLTQRPCTCDRMTRARAESLRPLLEAQPYIRGVEWSGPATLGVTDLDRWRTAPHRERNLTDIACDVFNVPRPPRDEPWLTVPFMIPFARVLFVRSLRRQSAAFDWPGVYRKYVAAAAFIGLPDEHEAFERDVGPVELCPAWDWMEVAETVAAAEIVVSNNTGILWVAEGMKKTIVYEAAEEAYLGRWERAGFYADGTLPELP
jgi:hypothetical protein